MSIRYDVGRWLGDRIQVALEGVMPRIIMDGLGKSPYLSRFYIFGAPTMPDGSSPFDQFGNPKRDAKWKDGWGLYIHRFHRSDVDQELHNRLCTTTSGWRKTYTGRSKTSREAPRERG